jgi:HSP90 family molecular chaperone
MNNPEPNSKWHSTNSTKFTVLKTSIQPDGTWVYYQRHPDGAEFNCLVEAFLHRFVKDISHS